MYIFQSKIAVYIIALDVVGISDWIKRTGPRPRTSGFFAVTFRRRAITRDLALTLFNTMVRCRRRFAGMRIIFCRRATRVLTTFCAMAFFKISFLVAYFPVYFVVI